MKESKEYIDLCKKVPSVSYGKEARALHKDLKRYGDGLPMYARYPFLPAQIGMVFVILMIIWLWI